MTLKHVVYTEGGVKKLSKKLYGIFSDHRGIIRKLPLFSDRKNSAEAGAGVVAVFGKHAAGDPR
jgi:hypothetical protein